MPMKKITFNALLNHKAHNYKPMQIEVSCSTFFVNCTLKKTVMILYLD